MLLHKRGDQPEISNYGPKVIESRIGRQLDKHPPPEQAGFRPGLSTTAHFHTLNQTINRCNEYNIPLYIAFIDYTKAFDSLNVRSILYALQSQGIEPIYIKLINSIYNNNTAVINMQSTSTPFKIT